MVALTLSTVDNLYFWVIHMAKIDMGIKKREKVMPVKLTAQVESCLYAAAISTAIEENVIWNMKLIKMLPPVAATIHHLFGVT